MASLVAFGSKSLKRLIKLSVKTVASSKNLTVEVLFQDYSHGCWQGSISHHLGFYIWLPHNVVNDFSQGWKINREYTQVKSHSL